MAEDKDTSFKVTDRRKFNPDGSPRAQDEETGTTSAAAASAPAPENQSEPRPAADEALRDREPSETAAAQGAPVSDHGAARPLQPEPASLGGQAQRSAGQGPHNAASQAYEKARGPQAPGANEASFVNLINMLAVEAAMSLGLIETQGREQPPIDLEAARQMIDILGILQTKTRGNLTPEEASLLDNILTDLRMQFVAMSSRR